MTRQPEAGAVAEVPTEVGAEVEANLRLLVGEEVAAREAARLAASPPGKCWRGKGASYA